ncbi:MAG: hypothetical protein IPH24_12915 [Crocinitomicaceae bacterium]|nr:hypothetical protein [Crocinitomicaceae bacterium]
MILKLLLAVGFMTLAIIAPLNFNFLLENIVVATGLGWVFTTILIRLLSIILVAISLRLLTRAFQKTSKIKTWVCIAVAFPLGFGISFITPIYTTDYGMLTDDFTLENINALEHEIGGSVINESGYSFVTFFTTTCPHCKAASEKIGINLENGQKVPVIAIFPGEEGDTKTFLEKHNGENFTTYRLNNDPLFIDISGGTFPSMFLLDKEGKTVYHWTGDQLNYTGLDYLKSLEQ